MIYWIWVLIVGAIIGLLAGVISGRGGAMSFLAKVLAGLVGSPLGEALFGAWGPQMAGMAIVPSVLGAVILVLVVSFVLGFFNRKNV